MAPVVRIIHNYARQGDSRAVSFKINWLSYLVLTNEGLSCLDNVLTLNTSLVFMYAESCFFAGFLLNILGKTDFRAPYMPLSASDSYGYCFV